MLHFQMLDHTKECYDEVNFHVCEKYLILKFYQRSDWTGRECWGDALDDKQQPYLKSWLSDIRPLYMFFLLSF